MSSFFGCEHPLDASAAIVALAFPGCDFGDELFAAVDAPIEALTAKDADLDFDHVEPACVLGRVMELDPPQHAVRLCRWERLVESA